MTVIAPAPRHAAYDPAEHDIGILGRIGLGVVRHARLTTVVWLLVIVGLGVFAPKVEANLSGAGWQANGSESVQARELAQAHFGGNASSAIQVVVRSADGPVTEGTGAQVIADATRLLMIVPALAVAAGFVWWERTGGARRGHPLMDLSLFRISSYSGGLATALVYFAAFTGTSLVLSLFLQDGLGFSALQSGATASALALGLAVGATVASRFVNRYGRAVLVVQRDDRSGPGASRHGQRDERPFRASVPPPGDAGPTGGVRGDDRAEGRVGGGWKVRGAQPDVRAKALLVDPLLVDGRRH